MVCNYELSMPQHSWLIRQPKSAVNIYYLHGIVRDGTDLVQTIDMKMISETQPEQRLKKLIHKGSLEEAEVITLNLI